MRSASAEGGRAASRRGLTIGDLESRTGVAATTLRSWEKRFGFPAPARSTGGQRRYAEEQVGQVQQVLAERARGLGLAAAIALAAEADAEDPGRSVYAELRAQHPQLDVMTVGIAVMRALTYAIEDECLAHSSRPLLLGCFQSRASFDLAGDRWRELARGASRAVVLADFGATDPDASPERVALPSGSPLLNEWGLVCDDDEISVALVGWERPAARAGERRTFEAVVSTDHRVVRDTAAGYARAARDADLPDADRLVPAAVARDADGRRSMSLLRRFAQYADHHR